MRVFYWQGVVRQSAAIRQGDWKLVVHRTDSADHVELFNLADDPYERRDRAQEQPKRDARLLELLAEETSRDNDSTVK